MATSRPPPAPRADAASAAERGESAIDGLFAFDGRDAPVLVQIAASSDRKLW